MEDESKPKLDSHGKVLKSAVEKVDDGKLRDSYGRILSKPPKEE